jgi:hypothetical protein
VSKQSEAVARSRTAARLSVSFWDEAILEGFRLGDLRAVLSALDAAEKLLDEATRRLDLAQSTLSLIEHHPNDAASDTVAWMKGKAGEASDKDWAAQEGHIMSWMTRANYKRAEPPKTED